MKTFGCSPPYVSKNPALWCSKQQIDRKSLEQTESFSQITEALWKGYISQGQCLLPCQRTSFRIVKSGENFLVGEIKGFGVHILFDKSVTVTKSHFSIDILTLLTRLGGAVGVGKEGWWIVMIMVNFCLSAFKRYQ